MRCAVAMRPRRQSRRRALRPPAARSARGPRAPDRAVRMSLTVLDPGAYSIIVDAGRPHHRSLGVPVGGAADLAAFQQGNALVGNDPNAPTLEVALAGPSLRAEQDTAAVVFGAPFDVTIYDRRVPTGATFTL